MLAHLSHIRAEVYPGDGMSVHGAQHARQAHDGGLEALALVVRVVGEVAQQQVRHQLVPLHRTVPVRVYLAREKFFMI